MRIDIITVLPEMLEGFVHESILARAETLWRQRRYGDAVRTYRPLYLCAES